MSKLFSLSAAVSSICICLILVCAGCNSIVASRSNKPNPSLVKTNVTRYAISESGDKLVYVSGDSLEFANLPDRKSRILTSIKRDQQIDFLQISPDSSAVIFTRTTQNKKSELILLPLDDKPTLLFKADAFAGVEWSDDSKSLAWIACQSQPIAGGYLYIQNIKNRAFKPKLLYTDEAGMTNIAQPVWLQNNGLIAFRYKSKQIILFDIKGKIQGQISPKGKFPLHGAYTISPLAFSPNKGKLAFGFDRNIWIGKSVPNAELSKISNDSPRNLCWLSDKYLAYVSSIARKIFNPIGGIAIPVPHRLTLISTDSDDRHILVDEKQGIFDLQCTSDGKLFYMSRNSLFMINVSRYLK